MSVRDQLWLAGGAGWIIAAGCFWLFDWYSTRRHVRDMGLDELKALCAQIRDELKVREQPNAEVQKLYDESRRTPDDVA